MVNLDKMGRIGSNRPITKYVRLVQKKRTLKDIDNFKEEEYMVKGLETCTHAREYIKSIKVTNGAKINHSTFNHSTFDQLEPIYLIQI
jgi:hypothetical protein